MKEDFGSSLEGFEAKYYTRRLWFEEQSHTLDSHKAINAGNALLVVGGLSRGFEIFCWLWRAAD